MNEEVRKAVETVTKKLADEGKIIEAGFAAMQIQILQNAPALQISEMRKAFFFGAQHLFASIMGMLEPGAEPTDKDLERMDLIDKEIKNFVKDVAKGMN